MNSINKTERLGYLFCLMSYQNEDSPANYLPFLGRYTEEVIGESKAVLLEIIKDTSYTEEDLDDLLMYNPDPDSEMGWRLALVWARFIQTQPDVMELLGKELYDYFWWNGEEAEFYYWLQGCYYKTPQEAMEDAKEIFGWQD